MTREEAKLILGVYRCGQEDALDPFFTEALKLASEDAELAKWFAAEQAFDLQITAGLARDEAPVGLKAALLATLAPPAKPRWTLPRALSLAGAAAVIAVLLTLAAVHPREDAASGHLADFRTEMTSFLLPSPPLPLETKDLAKIQTWLAAHSAASDIRVPAKVQQLPPLGCRTLIFRGHKVGLICFQRAKGQVAHLLVIDRAAFAASELPAGRDIQPAGEWMTASWVEGEKLYVLAAQGDQAVVEQFL